MRLREPTSKSIYLRLTDKQYAYLESVSKKADLSIPELLRMYIDTILYNCGVENENN